MPFLKPRGLALGAASALFSGAAGVRKRRASHLPRSGQLQNQG